MGIHSSPNGIPTLPFAQREPHDMSESLSRGYSELARASREESQGLFILASCSLLASVPPEALGRRDYASVALVISAFSALFATGEFILSKSFEHSANHYAQVFPSTTEQSAAPTNP